jgi:hypothetical protein
MWDRLEARLADTLGRVLDWWFDHPFTALIGVVGLVLLVLAVACAGAILSTPGAP